ncbi:MAG: ABC transporter permease [Alphaproteobacteria bacterium]
MLVFLLKRCLGAVILLVVMSFVTYGLIGLMPGDPIDLMVSGDPNLTPEDAARLKALYGLDQPLMTRYWHWLQSALQGEFGFSRLKNQPVGAVMGQALASTLWLVIPAFVLALGLAVPLGVWAARKPGGIADQSINLFAFAGLSVPQFWLAILLILTFAVTLGWLPASMPAGADGLRFASGLVLPVVTLALLSSGGYVRFVRSAVIEELTRHHIRTARAKGVSEPAVLWRHALRGALNPVITVVGLGFGALFSGALITETIFAMPGMGKLVYDAIMGNDYNLALVGLLLTTAMVLIGNLLADIAYVALDPRIKLDGEADE